MDKVGEKGKIRISITIDSDIYTQFKTYCEERGMKMSSKAEQLMKESVKNSTLNKFIK